MMAIIFQSDFETADYSELTDTTGGEKGGVFVCGGGSQEISTDYAHSGMYSSKMIHPVAETESGTRAMRWGNWVGNTQFGIDPGHISLYYSCWFYFPELLTIDGPGFVYLNLMQFKSAYNEA